MKIDISGNYDLFEYGYNYKVDGHFKPISDFYKGTIQYTADGYMTVVLRFEEIPTEVSDVVAYSGTYIVEGNKILHKVTHSVRPDYEGQTLVRSFTLSEGVLELEFENTPEFRKFARWRRV